MSKRPLVLVLLAAACGGGDEPPPPTTEVTIAVTRLEAPVEGATVVFHGADGELLGSGVTGEGGVITGEIGIGGAVTVVDPDDPLTLVTLTSVDASTEPYEVPLTPPIDFSDLPATGSLAIAAPTDAPPTGTHHLMLDTGCGTFQVDALPASVPINARCVSDAGTVPVIATAWTENQNIENPGEPLAYVAGVATAATGSTEFSFAPAAWSTTCSTVDVTTEPFMGVQLWPRMEGLNFFRSDAAYCGSQVPQYPVLDFGEGLTASSFTYVGGGDSRWAKLQISYDALPASIDVDLQADLLSGDVQLLAMDGQGARWTTDPALGGARAIAAELMWSLPDFNYVHWTFLVPMDATLVSRPELPDEVVTWPSLGNATDHVAELRYYDTPWLSSHGAFLHQLAVLDLQPRVTRQPPSVPFRTFRQRFYPDAGN